MRAVVLGVDNNNRFNINTNNFNNNRPARGMACPLGRDKYSCLTTLKTYRNFWNMQPGILTDR